MLTTLERAKTHLRLIYFDADGQPISDTVEDALIEGYVNAASSYITNYCEQEFEVVPDDVEHACLLLVGDFYNIREDTVTGLSINATKAVERLLAPHRKKLGV